MASLALTCLCVLDAVRHCSAVWRSCRSSCKSRLVLLFFVFELLGLGCRWEPGTDGMPISYVDGRKTWLEIESSRASTCNSHSFSISTCIAYCISTCILCVSGASCRPVSPPAASNGRAAIDAAEVCSHSAWRGRDWNEDTQRRWAALNCEQCLRTRKESSTCICIICTNCSVTENIHLWSMALLQHTVTVWTVFRECSGMPLGQKRLGFVDLPTKARSSFFVFSYRHFPILSMILQTFC